MLCPIMVHVYSQELISSWYSCVPENEAPVFMYKVILVGSDDCEQVNGILAEPPHCTVVLLGPVHCPLPVPVLPARTQYSGLSTVRADCVLIEAVATVHQVKPAVEIS